MVEPVFLQVIKTTGNSAKEKKQATIFFKREHELYWIIFSKRLEESIENIKILHQTRKID
jgi:hypothetical protein